MELEGPAEFKLSLGAKIAIFGTVGLAIVVAAVIVVYNVMFPTLRFPAPSGKFKAERIGMFANADYTKVVDAAKDTPGDGADDILALMTRYKQKQAEIANNRRSGGSTERDVTEQLTILVEQGKDVDVGASVPLPVAAELLSAADKKDFTSAKLMDVKEIEWRDPPEITAFECISMAGSVEAMIASKRGDAAKAESIYRAIILVGRRLRDSGERVWVQQLGLDMQLQATTGLRELWGEKSPEKDNAAKDYANAVYKTRITFSNNFAMDRTLNKWDVGDLVMIARDHPERA
ncbi:MAG: hypothetical protein PHU85_19420, partial [Phycisphaerae bacterium]|nr:hypothetical protein [Phycisphaerae bacterium]